MRDRLIQKSVQLTHIDIMDGIPSVVFLNGKFWGVYEIKERVDKYYIQGNHNVDCNKIDMLKYDGDIIEGTNTSFLKMVDFITLNDMTMPVNYDSVKQLLDIENFCDYFITETYYDNYDWIGTYHYTNNIKFWHTNNPSGKWRYILWDIDRGLGLTSDVGMTGPVDYNRLETVISPQNNNPHSAMFKSLLLNDIFRNYFINRYADLLNTIFLPFNIRQLTYKLRNEMQQEMEMHFNKWNLYDFGGIYDIQSWFSEIECMLSYSDKRPSFTRSFIKSQFALKKKLILHLMYFQKMQEKLKYRQLYLIPFLGQVFILMEIL